MSAFDAIWDTGATGSVITQNVVDACGLLPTGMAQVHGVHGVQAVETYLVNIVLPNRVRFTGVRVTKGVLTPGAEMLIGMNIITRGDFAVSNFNGRTMFSFRAPSREEIDFVAATNRENTLAKGNRKTRRAAGKKRA